MALIPFIELGFGVVNLVNSIRSANKLKKQIAEIRKGIGETKTKIKAVQDKTRAAGLDLGTANQHSLLADRIYTGLNTERLTLQAAAPDAGITKVKNRLLNIQKDFVTNLLNEDTTVMQPSPAKDELHTAKGALRSHFNDINKAADRDALLNAVQAALQDCISIAGVRTAYFSRLGNELANV